MTNLMAAAPKSSTANKLDNVADTTTSATLAAANQFRRGLIIANTSSAALLVALGSAAASATNYSYRAVQYGVIEIPYGYTGPVQGIWESDPGDGVAIPTEVL